jgi:hypothetical protein
VTRDVDRPLPERQDAAPRPRGEVSSHPSPDGALDEIAALAGNHRRGGPLATRLAYSAHQGQMTAASSTALHALGTSPQGRHGVRHVLQARWDYTVSPGRRRHSGGGRGDPKRRPGRCPSPPTCIWASPRRCARPASRSSLSSRAARARPRASTSTCRSASEPSRRWRSA